uniref:AB hydrolase-1 domain-containing protein n=1 Tax=Rhabditophanes sp. KR3021 TaxID=114890 RepID=A0AC35TQP2_9BILA
MLVNRFFQNIGLIKNQAPKIASIKRDLLEGGNFEKHIYNDVCQFKNGKGEMLQIEAKTIDTIPNGRANKTIIAVSGAPGNHNDWKYILNHCIQNNYRLICMNLPGFGSSGYSDKLTLCKKERVNFIEAVIKERNVSIDKAILLGHSRGTPTILKLAVKHKKDISGIILVNGLGVRPHRGFKPKWLFPTISYIHQLSPQFIRNTILYPFVFKMYTILGLKTEDGLVAMNCLRSANEIDFQSNKENCQLLNDANLRILQLFGGKDWLIEKEISLEFAKLFKDMVYLSTDKVNDDAIISLSVEDHFNHGKRAISIRFEQDGHFINKFRSSFIASSIDNIFKYSHK